MSIHNLFMESTRNTNLARLALAMQAQGIASARALADSLQVSQPTLSRWIARLPPQQVERFGATRNAQYALRRDVRSLGSSWPVYQIDASGRSRVAGELRALHGGFRYRPSDPVPAWLVRDYPAGAFSGLPFFLQDIGPEGYVGRAIARSASAGLNLPDNPANWNDDDLLTYLVTQGDDLPGNLVLGDRALELAVRRIHSLPQSAIPLDRRQLDYGSLANQAQRGEQHGSSAGGEQPKFLTTIRQSESSLISVLVKFSVADTSPVSERWADLLLCEHLAAEVISTRGYSAARTDVLDAAGRRFLEVERFDRTPSGGRCGLLSLAALEDGLLAGSAPDWISSATLLSSAGLLSTAHARELRWRWCFGNLIANTDMHRSNTSVFLGHEIAFQLTPSYDMLPMLYAPGNQGELGARDFVPRPPLPAVADVWPQAAEAALDFWTRVAADSRVSGNFSHIASVAHRAVKELMTRFA